MTEQTTQNDEDINPENTIKILVASDIHLGYEEKDPIRGEDSFIAFEEVLQHAVINDVDAILLGGDLFHIANPSTNTLNRCCQLLKTYTFGDKPIALQFLCDKSEDQFESLRHLLNYADPNINIAIPVFSIHGNHDDPSGFGRMSTVDLLSTNGYVNYFGKWADLSRIIIDPILLKKGETKLALYGLGHISDARLCRMFDEAKVFLQKPEEPGWFNVMVLHQNRADRGVKNYLPESALPKFLDLVIWGHEHDCRIVPEENVVKHFFVSQPGSTVATSLSEGESIQKCCGLLSINKGIFRMDPIPLKTVRPFVFESINLASVQDELRLDEGDVTKKVQDFAAERIERLIERAHALLTDDERQPKLPLIRLRLEITETKQQFNDVRFGHHYFGRVGNPINMVTFKKKVSRVKRETGNEPDEEVLQAQVQNFRTETARRAEQIAEKYFLEGNTGQKLEVLCPSSMTEVVRRLVDQKDDDAADKVLKFYEQKAINFLERQDAAVTEDNIDELLAEFHSSESNLHEQALTMLDSRSIKPPSDEPEVVESAGKPARGGARGGARGAAASKSTRGARGGKKAATATAAANGGKIASLFSQQSNKSSIGSVATRTCRSSVSSRSVVYSSDSESN